MKIFIKNMVCARCELAVETIFSQLEIPVKSVQLGEVETELNLNKNELSKLNSELQKIGFEILESASQKQIEATKKFIIQKISELDIAEDFILSEFIAGKTNRDYSAVSKLFSQNEGITLEQFFILQKIEKAKELLAYNESTLSEIAVKLGYKSVQHLSSQFKNITGFTPTQFKKLNENRRQPLDSF